MEQLFSKASGFVFWYHTCQVQL